MSSWWSRLHPGRGATGPKISLTITTFQGDAEVVAWDLNLKRVESLELGEASQGKNNHLKMYLLLKMVIFKLVMLVFGGVRDMNKWFPITLGQVSKICFTPWV